jgi:hypothetical protein
MQFDYFDIYYVLKYENINKFESIRKIEKKIKSKEFFIYFFVLTQFESYFETPHLMLYLI